MNISLLDEKYNIDLQLANRPDTPRINEQVLLPKVYRLKTFRIDKPSQSAIK